jgi:hypothetical protein
MFIADQDIGGARVRRTFTFRGEQLKPQTHLTADQVLSMSVPNRNALVEGGWLEVYPRRAAAEKPKPQTPEERFVFRASKDSKMFNVFAGRKLNSKPLTRRRERCPLREL